MHIFLFIFFVVKNRWGSDRPSKFIIDFESTCNKPFFFVFIPSLNYARRKRCIILGKNQVLLSVYWPDRLYNDRFPLQYP